MKFGEDSVLNKIHLLILGLIGLIGTCYIAYHDFAVLRHNGCSEEKMGIVERVGQGFIEIRFDGDLFKRRETEKLTSFFENGQEVLLSYCEETGVLLIYNYDKWSPNWLIVVRAILGVFFSLLVLGGIFRKKQVSPFLK